MTVTKAVGDKVELGDIIGYPCEAADRLGRVMGIRKDHCKKPIIYRQFRLGDPDNAPSGEFFATWFVVPWARPTTD